MLDFDRVVLCLHSICDIMNRISRHSRVEESVHFGNLRVAFLPLADVEILLASSARDLQQALGWFEAECEAVSTFKFEVMTAYRMGKVGKCPGPSACQGLLPMGCCGLDI